MTDTKHKPMTADEALDAVGCAAETVVRLKGAGINPRLAHLTRDALKEARATFAAMIAERDALRKSLKEYRRLHDFISDAIEGGRLTEADVPDDYHAFIHQLEECARLEYFANQAIDAARAESGSHE